MTLTSDNLFVPIAVAVVIVAAIMLWAPSLQAGRDRLTLLVNTLGIAVVFAGWAIGIALFVWGVTTWRKDLIYFSFLPMVLGGLTYNLITRRHQAWYGIFGFDDSSARWRSFWDETRRVWGFLPRSGHGQGSTAGSGGLRTPPRGPSGPMPGPMQGQSTRSFSVSFGSRGSGASLWAPILSFAATRLATGHITVFPNSLEFAIVLDPAGSGHQPHLDAFRQSLVVRRRDGGHLQLAVQSDLAFLDATAGPRRFDGSYTIEVGLVTARLTPGPFSGSLMIDTGDPAAPLLTVPVAGTVT